MDGEIKTTPYSGLHDHGVEAFREFMEGHLPALLGMELLSTDPRRLMCRVPIRGDILAPHGYLHGGAMVSVADTLCGFGAIVNLPPGAVGFITVELKTNFLSSLSEGAFTCEAVPLHVGRNTQVWDAVLCDEREDRKLAYFRCTQMVLWGNPPGKR